MSSPAPDTLKVNGKTYSVSEKHRDMLLVDYLRETLGLTGVKKGCGIGACGSCTVVMNDKAVKSCVIKVGKAVGKEVLTIEGLESEKGELHPIQQAFIDAGAIQCGFCTPGMILAAYALLRETAGPTRTDIRQALKGNLCRCTGYQQIVDAVETAAELLDRKKD